jgi:hypothetical protein
MNALIRAAVAAEKSAKSGAQPRSAKLRQMLQSADIGAVWRAR